MVNKVQSADNYSQVTKTKFSMRHYWEGLLFREWILSELDADINHKLKQQPTTQISSSCPGTLQTQKETKQKGRKEEENTNNLRTLSISVWMASSAEDATLAARNLPPSPFAAILKTLSNVPKAGSKLSMAVNHGQYF